jgi:2-C-methyl-D-erythritol 4-phosphate cytidylyltransferase
MGGQDKLLLPLGDEPVIAHTLRALENCPYIQEILVVTRQELIVPLSKLCADSGFAKVSKVLLGGDTRTQSVRIGVSEASERAELIAIQDGARPLVSQKVLEDAILTAAQCGAAAPAVPVKDTIKRADRGVVTETPAREELFAVQTPQVFSADLIRAALHRAVEDGAALTDDCAAVERIGMKVTLTRGAEENIKITTPADLAVAQALLRWREDA